MTWIFVAAGLVVAGVAVLGFAAGRVVTAARGLTRQITQLNEQFREKAELGDEAAASAAYDLGEGQHSALTLKDVT